jgi:hypothetical protein
MARTVKDAKLQTSEARRRLKAQGKPHYRTLEEGLHLGYRKPRSGAGKWVARFYDGGQAYTVETIAIADDLSDANDATVLSFDQAQKKARKLRDERDRSAAGKRSGPYTVADAMVDYLAFLDARRKTGRDAKWKSDAFIMPTLGSKEVASSRPRTLKNGSTASPRRRHGCARPRARSSGTASTLTTTTRCVPAAPRRTACG